MDTRSAVVRPIDHASCANPLVTWRHGAITAVVAVVGASVLAYFVSTGAGPAWIFATHLPVVASIVLLGGFGPGILATLLRVSLSYLGSFSGLFPSLSPFILVIFLGMGLLLAAISRWRFDRGIHNHSIPVGIRHDKPPAEPSSDLETSDELGDAIFRTAQMIVLQLDAAGRIVRFNPFMEQLSGWSVEEVRGKDWFTTFVPERERQRITHIFQRALETEPTRANRNSILTRDGREREIEWYDTSLRGPNGAITGLLALGQDVTDRLQVLSALRE